VRIKIVNVTMQYLIRVIIRFDNWLSDDKSKVIIPSHCRET